MEKGLEDTSKEAKETKSGKGRDTAEAELPAAAAPATAELRADLRKPRILHEVLGCSGPILQIPTPPPDGSLRF